MLTLVPGDPQGIALVADVCEPERQGKSGHFIVAALNSNNIDSDTLDYLKRRGCIDLPTLDIQQALIQAYFHYVHPFFPVIHASSFVISINRPAQKEASLHLLWSVFLAPANVKTDTIAFGGTIDKLANFRSSSLPTQQRSTRLVLKHESR